MHKIGVSNAFTVGRVDSVPHFLFLHHLQGDV